VPVAEHTITIDQLPVYFRQAPTTGAPPLYLHGIPTSSDDFVEFLELTGGIAPDLIGFGRSAKAGHLDYSISGQADFLETLLELLGVQRVRLVAHGWGAAGGLAFAQRHPERVERIVLLGALPLLPGFSWHRLARMWRRPLVGELVMGATTKLVLGRILRHAAGGEETWPPARVEAVWQQFDQGTQRAILRLHRGAGEAQLTAAGEHISARLKMPALILWGQEDPWFSSEFAEVYARRLHNAEIELYPGAGHWPWLARPEARERVAAFLAGS